MFELDLGDGLGIIELESGPHSRYIRIPTSAANYFFKDIAIRYPDIAKNELGLYSHASIGRDGSATFQSLEEPKHILQPRNNACIWKDKGRVTNKSQKIKPDPVEYNGSECPDAFYGSCFESIFGVGNGVRDLFGTPESKAMMQELIEKINLGLGNSLFELASFGDHDLIDDATTNGWFTPDINEWDDYVDQQKATTGWYTRIDYLKDVDGLENFNVQIAVGETDGSQFVGDPEDLFRRLAMQAKGKLAIIVKQKKFRGYAPIILVTDGIYNAYEEKLINKFPAIPESYQFYLNGQTRDLMPGVLKWNGYWIVRDDAQTIFDDITGTITHRAVLTVPGNFGLVTDIPDLDQFDGIGLQITQHLDAPWKGKVFFDTTFKVATAILNTDLMINASLTLTPEE